MVKIANKAAQSLEEELDKLLGSATNFNADEKNVLFEVNKRVTNGEVVGDGEDKDYREVNFDEDLLLWFYDDWASIHKKSPDNCKTERIRRYMGNISGEVRGS